jgi:hypothetical protein
MEMKKAMMSLLAGLMGMSKMIRLRSLKGKRTKMRMKNLVSLWIEKSQQLLKPQRMRQLQELGSWSLWNRVKVKILMMMSLKVHSKEHNKSDGASIL